MGWFKNLISDGASKLVDSVSSGLDSLFTSDEERLQARAVIEKQVQDYQVKIMDAQSRYDAEITARWKSDNENLVTRLVRPVSYGFMLIVFFVISFSDGNIGGFKINPAYIPVYETLLITMTIAYFGSRGTEKIMKTVNGKKKPKPESWG